MLPALDNFLSYGKDTFIARPDYVEKMLDIYVTSISSEQLGEADRVEGSKLAESMLLNLRGHIDVVGFDFLSSCEQYSEVFRRFRRL
jgi:importin-7